MSIITDSSGAVFLTAAPPSTSSGHRLQQAQGIAFGYNGFLKAGSFQFTHRNKFSKAKLHASREIFANYDLQLVSWQFSNRDVVSRALRQAQWNPQPPGIFSIITTRIINLKTTINLEGFGLRTQAEKSL